MPAGWVQNKFKTNQLQNAFENRNVKRYNLTILTRLFL